VKLIIAFFLSILFAIAQEAGARSCNVEGLIEILHESEGGSNPVVVRFSFPDKYKKYEFSSVDFQRNRTQKLGQKESSSFVYIVPVTEMRGGQRTGAIRMGVEELAKWSLTVKYVFPLEETSAKHWVGGMRFNSHDYEFGT